MLGKLITITRYARVSGHDRLGAFDERAAVTVAAFMSIVSTRRPSGTNVYAWMYLRVLGEISTAPTYNSEVPVPWLIAGSTEPHAMHPTLHPRTDEPAITAAAVLDWAVTRAIITTTDRTLLQRAYLDQTDLALAAVADEAGLTPAALRKRLSRALARIRDHLTVTNRPSATPPRYARERCSRPAAAVVS